MSFQVTVSERAAAELNEIEDYLKQFDEELALQTRADILAYFRKLGSNPFVGDVIRQTRNRTIRESRFKAYRIYFRVVDAQNSVHILRIRHYKRRPLKSPE